MVRYWAGAGAELFVVDAPEEVDDVCISNITSLHY